MSTAHRTVRLRLAPLLLRCPNLTPDTVKTIIDLINVELEPVGIADLAELADVISSIDTSGRCSPTCSLSGTNASAGASRRSFHTERSGAQLVCPACRSTPSGSAGVHASRPIGEVSPSDPHGGEAQPGVQPRPGHGRFEGARPARHSPVDEGRPRRPCSGPCGRTGCRHQPANVGRATVGGAGSSVARGGTWAVALPRTRG